mgnify:CR=1 FL=1
MNLLAILLLGIALSLDTFAVSLTLGLLADRTTHRQKVRFLVVIGLFHFLMIVIGWFMGETVSRLIADYDHWIAFGLLLFIGGKMIQEGLSARGDSVSGSDLLSLRNTLLLGIALSIDALITGFTIGLVQVRLPARKRTGRGADHRPVGARYLGGGNRHRTQGFVPARRKGRGVRRPDSDRNRNPHPARASRRDRVAAAFTAASATSGISPRRKFRRMPAGPENRRFFHSGPEQDKGKPGIRPTGGADRTH